MNSDVLDL